MIKIEDKVISPYVIHVEDNQFTVGIPKLDKHGKEVLTNPSYFTKLSYALKHISKSLLVASNSQSVLTVKEFIDLHNEVNELLLERIKV